MTVGDVMSRSQHLRCRARNLDGTVADDVDRVQRDVTVWDPAGG